MKDDIDSILDSLFREGKLNFGGAQNTGSTRSQKESAERDHTALQKDNSQLPALELENTLTQKQKENAALLEEVQKINQKVQSSLQRDIEALTIETQKELNDLTERLEKDEQEQKRPRKLEAVGEAPSIKKDLEKAFQAAEELVNRNVIGQEGFVAALGGAFRRPLVVGIKYKMPSNRCVIIGSNGTGRHMALENYTKSLQDNGVLTSGEVRYMDLSKYNLTSSDKVFIQDFYAAISGKAQVIAFENFEKCHGSVLKVVADIYIDGEVRLDGRYAEQKGVLVDIGNALVKEAVSSLSAEGKYLFLITDQKENKLMDAFGARFLSSCGDVCRTSSFSDEDIKRIAEQLLHTFCTDAKKILACSLTFDAFAVETLAAKYIPDSGIKSLVRYLQILHQALEDYKLKNRGAETGIIDCEAGELYIRFAEETVHVLSSADNDGAVAEVKSELSEIVGLGNVKDYIYSLEDNFKVQQMRRARGMKAEFPAMHMIFTGNPGTGKTTIARIISRYLKAIGVLSGGQLIEVTRADLVGRYVGHTAPLTQSAIQSALGGVLFIDEAYALYRGRDDSFGLEAIDTLVKGMEDHRNNLVVILAGYSMEMEEFLTSNSGLKSRFPNLIEFPDYSAQELVDITKTIVRQKGYIMDKSCEHELFVYYDIMQKTGDPRTNGNGRMARNKVEEAILNCSKRNLSATDDDLFNLELLKIEDFRLNESK